MKQTVSKIVKQEKRNRREGVGRCMAISQKIYRLQNSETFYVESERSTSRYYFVRYNPSVFEWCSCKDFESNRSDKCKHIFAVEYGIRFNTVMEVDRLPEEVRQSNNNKTTIMESRGWEDDEYDF